VILKIFTQPNCPKCPPAKALARQLTVHNPQPTTEFFDVSTVDGMAEGAFYSVMGTPSLILVDDKGKVVGEWRGKVPSRKEIEKFLISGS